MPVKADWPLSPDGPDESHTKQPAVIGDAVVIAMGVVRRASGAGRSELVLGAVGQQHGLVLGVRPGLEGLLERNSELQGLSTGRVAPRAGERDESGN